MTSFNPPPCSADFLSLQNTPTTTHPSPTPSLTHEYSIALTTDSYNEIWSMTHHFNPDHTIVATTSSSSHLLVSQLLRPNRELVDEVLHRVKPARLALLVAAYFNLSEQAIHLLYRIHHHSIIQARSLYSPLLELLDAPPTIDSFSQPQCDQALGIFTQFSPFDNPFQYPIPDAFQEIRSRFSELKQQLDHRLRKPRRFGFFTNSVQCLGTLVSHSHPSNHRISIAQIDAASKGAYVLNNDLDTIHRLVARLHGVVESDKGLVKIGLERGGDRYPIIIQEVVKQLRNNHPNFVSQLKDLEQHICLCFKMVNRARTQLLQQIHLQQNM